jgi:hypothetical protein
MLSASVAAAAVTDAIPHDSASQCSDPKRYGVAWYFRKEEVHND